MAGRLAAVFLAASTVAATGFSWPSPRWRDDPASFFRDVLGIEPWSRQVELCEAVRDHRRVAVASGHKVSKSCSAAGLGLWFLSSFEDARVVMTSVTTRQVNEILYREVRKLHARSGLCVACAKTNDEMRAAGEAGLSRPCAHSAILDGDPRELASSGIKLPDLRQLVGFTAKEAEAVAGISGKNIFYIVDEASGVPAEIYEAIEGNRAGGGRVLLISNPTKNSGEFFDAFHSKARFFRTLTISSEESPNVIAGREVIPGLCERAYIDEKREEWGVDSPMYRVRVKGEFCKNEEGKIVSLHLLDEAEKRWAETEADGRLFIGLDPAGEGSDGDETAWSARRGTKQIELRAKRGLSAERVLAETVVLIEELRHEGETPVLVVDRDGDIGAQVFGLLLAYVSQHHELLVLVGVRAGEPAKRQPKNYDRVRDELWANGVRWLREGGALLTNAKLAKEIHAPEWTHFVNKHGCLVSKATDKKTLRRDLGRSPDRADAWLLSLWEPRALNDEDQPAPQKAEALALTASSRRAELDDFGEGGSLDPYAGVDAWGRG